MDILAAKGDPEAWLQLIIFIIIGLVYGLSALFKSRFEDSEGQEENPEQSPDYRDKRAEQRPRIPRISRISRDKRKPKPEPRQKPKPKRAKAKRSEPQRPKQPVGASIRKKKSDIFSELDKALKPSETKGKIYPGTTKSETGEFQQESTPAFEILGKTELQRAIVHFEIFGKPISVRQEEKESF